jgi:hypothetical protein
VHGGGAFTSAPGGGTASLLPANSAISSVPGAARLVSSFQPTVPPGVPAPNLTVDETDKVTITTSAANRFAVAVGGGLKYALSRRWGLRLDVRDHLYSNPLTTTVDASPSIASSGTSSLTFGTTPRLTFSSPTTLLRSTLSGPAVSHFETFRAIGTERYVVLTGGLNWHL